MVQRLVDFLIMKIKFLLGVFLFLLISCKREEKSNLEIKINESKSKESIMINTVPDLNPIVSKYFYI